MPRAADFRRPRGKTVNSPIFSGIEEGKGLFQRTKKTSILATMTPKAIRSRYFTALLLVLGLGTSLADAFLPATAQEQLPAGRLRVDVEVVNIFCTVKDRRGALVTSLQRPDFEIFEDGKKQDLRYFERETDRPLTLALLVDTSGSQQTVLPAEKEAAIAFLREVLRPSDLASLVTFDVNIDLLQDFTADLERLERAIRRARINAPVGLGPLPRTNAKGTRLFDAVYLTTQEKLEQEAGRKAIIVISDGVDMGSDKKLKEAMEAAQRSDTFIYSIRVADPIAYGRSGDTFVGMTILEDLARETGGRAFNVKDPDKLKDAFAQIADELRSQYSLGYSTTNHARDGRFRKIDVRVKGDGLRVQARRGYYAPNS